MVEVLAFWSVHTAGTGNDFSSTVGTPFWGTKLAPTSE